MQTPPTFIITEAQIGRMIGILADTPYRFASPMHDILRVIIQEQTVKQDTPNDTKKDPEG